MELTEETTTINDDLLVVHKPGERECVMEIIHKAEERPGDFVCNCVGDLEDAGFDVVVEGAFRILEGGTIISDGEYVLGPLDEDVGTPL